MQDGIDFLGCAHTGPIKQNHSQVQFSPLPHWSALTLNYEKEYLHIHGFPGTLLYKTSNPCFSTQLSLERIELRHGLHSHLSKLSRPHANQTLEHLFHVVLGSVQLTNTGHVSEHSHHTYESAQGAHCWWQHSCSRIVAH